MKYCANCKNLKDAMDLHVPYHYCAAPENLSEREPIMGKRHYIKSPEEQNATGHCEWYIERTWLFSRKKKNEKRS